MRFQQQDNVWSRLVPVFKVSKYDEMAFGAELTWRPGPGFAIGVGKRDLWLGWPRRLRTV